MEVTAKYQVPALRFEMTYVRTPTVWMLIFCVIAVALVP
jgi:hypothetical protein